MINSTGREALRRQSGVPLRWEGAAAPSPCNTFLYLHACIDAYLRTHVYGIYHTEMSHYSYISRSACQYVLTLHILQEQCHPNRSRRGSGPHQRDKPGHVICLAWRVHCPPERPSRSTKARWGWQTVWHKQGPLFSHPPARTYFVFCVSAAAQCLCHSYRDG
jgi:hypothetical protein